MYYLKKWFLRKLFKIRGLTPDDMPMVRYWKHSISVAAKVVTDESGALIMHMEGEDEPFPGFPRSHSLFGTLSKLKHEIKNQIFNDSWALLEKGQEKEAVQRIKQLVTGGLQEYLDICRYDMIPPEKMNVPIKELWRAFSVLEQKEPRLKWLKEVLTFIMQEDDGYRMRMQWMIQIFRPRWYKNPVKLLKMALTEVENGEVVRDMKDKIRLLKRVLLAILEDPYINQLFQEFCKEVDWNKLKLTKADKYHFRGKYFKVDLDKFEY